MKDDDFESWLRRAMTEPGASAETVVKRLHSEWGGARLYIPKKNTPDERAYQIGQRLGSGMGLMDAIREVGCSRRTGFRLMNRRWRLR